MSDRNTLVSRSSGNVAASLTERPIKLGTVVLTAVLFLISLLGPTWLHVPANPALHMPTLELNFSDLHKLTQTVPSNGIQQAYFAWLAWVLVIVTAIVALAWAATGSRGSAIGVLVLSVVGLVVMTFAVKGLLSWGDFVDQQKNIRIGAYLMIIANLVLLVSSAVHLARSRRTAS
jgi:hypothetical protein